MAAGAVVERFDVVEEREAQIGAGCEWSFAADEFSGIGASA